jgi:hypothetical protein
MVATGDAVVLRPFRQNIRQIWNILRLENGSYHIQNSAEPNEHTLSRVLSDDSPASTLSVEPLDTNTDSASNRQTWVLEIVEPNESEPPVEAIEE